MSDRCHNKYFIYWWWSYSKKITDLGKKLSISYLFLKQETLSASLVRKPYLNMIRKMIRAIIYIEMVLKQRYALYFLLWSIKKNSFSLYAFLSDCGNRPIACCHRDTRNKWCSTNSWFLLLTYLVLYAFRISVWNDVF